MVEASQESIESINTTIEIYDYEEMSENEIDTMSKQEKTPSDQGKLLKGIENCWSAALFVDNSFSDNFLLFQLKSCPW